jgi:hypothetical protein
LSCRPVSNEAEATIAASANFCRRDARAFSVPIESERGL